MAAKALPAQDVLLQLLSYDPETGKLFWKERGPEWFEPSATRSAQHIMALWNSRYAGAVALNCISANGYREGPILGDYVKAHRVIWKMMTGQDPDQVDHVDGDRANNRWGNLRNVDQSTNQRNARRRDDNSSGVVGVYWYPFQRKTGKWQVVCCDKHVGMFDTFEEAVAARKAAEREHGFHPNHGRAA